MPRKLLLIISVLLLILGSASLLYAGQTLPLPSRTDTELLLNGSFETDTNTDKIPDDWNSRNTSVLKSDKIKCDKVDSPVAYDGTCAFMFRGNPDGSSSNLSQVVSDLTPLTDGVTVQFSAYIDPRSGTPGATFGKAQITLSDATKINLKLAIPGSQKLMLDQAVVNAVEDYVQVTDSTTLALGAVTITKVKVKFSNNQNKGKFLIDAASLVVSVEDPTSTPTSTSGPTATPAQLTGSDSDGGDYFGNSVAASGDTIAVGAPFQSDLGASYVFTSSAGIWSEQQKLTADDGITSDQFGSAVALNGDTLLIGANNRTSGQGAVYVFTRSGGVWSQQQTLTASDGAGGDYFGTSIAISGTTAVIGAWGKATFRGAAYVFIYNGSSWVEQQKLTASDGTSSDQFGTSLSISGDTIAVGAFAKSTHKGAAYIFTRSGTTWSEQQKLTASDAANNDFFGLGIAVSGDTALIGAKYRTGGGAVYIFTRSGSVWTQEPTVLIGNDVDTGDSFGSTVKMSDDTAVI
ncbi:MAG TPA: FG-GAP repeat protein, partial [Phototrophicaceae bacterium]|nr:FG-GAP repeat protein [Phototrophicaceae bacterium]